MLRVIENNKYALLSGMLIFCCLQFCVGKLYGFSIFPDEFAYWAYAATATGKDWSGIMSLGSFYSYGYSLILLPVFLLGKDPVMAYRIAVALNFLFILISYFLLCQILGKEHQEDGKRCQIFAVVAVFYPAVVFYAQTSMTETLLLLLYLLVVWLLQKCTVEQNYSYKRIAVILLLNSYMYLVHMRTIGTFAVCVGLMTFRAYQEKRNWGKIFAVVISSGVLIAMSFAVKKNLSAVLYRGIDPGLYHINTYSGQFEKIKHIFEGGIRDFLMSLCGKVWYLGAASYGFAYWGYIFFIKRAKQAVSENAAIHYFFVIISVLIQVMVSAIYNVIPDTYDSVTFGRYQDYMMPLLIAFGFEEIIENIREIKKYLILTAGVLLIQMVIVLQYAGKLELPGIKGYFMAGMSLIGPEKMEISHFYFLAGLIAVLGMCFFTVVLKWCQKRGKWYISVCMIVVQLLTIERLGEQYLYPFNKLAYQDIQLANKIGEMTKDDTHEDVLSYIDYNEISAIGLIQYALPDMKIKVVSCNSEDIQKEIDKTSIVILGADTPVQGLLEQKYEKEIVSGHFILLYNE